MSDPTSPGADPPITVTLPLSAWTGLIGSLGKLPYREVALLINAITEQAIPQAEAAHAQGLAAEAGASSIGSARAN